MSAIPATSITTAPATLDLLKLTKAVGGQAIARLTLETAVLGTIPAAGQPASPASTPGSVDQTLLQGALLYQLANSGNAKLLSTYTGTAPGTTLDATA